MNKQRDPSMRSARFPRRRAARRRGTVYVYVLAISGIVSALGLIAIGLADTAVDRASASIDLAGAELRCQSAIELSIERLRTNPAWRDDFAQAPVMSAVDGEHQTVVYVTTLSGGPVNVGIPRDIRLVASTTSDDGSAAAWSVDLRVATRPRASASKGALETDSTILGLAPVAYWPLSEVAGTHARDVVGSSHGVYAGTVQEAAATRVEIAHRGWMDEDAMDDMTISFWYYAQPRSYNQPIFATANADGETEFAIFLSVNGEVTVCLAEPDGSEEIVARVATDFARWVHVAIAMSNGTDRIYIDGVEVEREHCHIPWRETTESVLIGSSAISGDLLDGWVADVAIFDEDLNAGEVRSLAQSNTRYTSGTDRRWGLELVPGSWQRLVD